jgi:hypothetical protein
MHENREISSTPWSEDQGRSAKAKSHTVDMHVLEKSNCAVVPVNQPNKGGQPSAKAGEGRAQTRENTVPSHMPPTQSGKCMSQRGNYTDALGTSHPTPEPVDSFAPRSALLSRCTLLRHSSFVRAVCVDALVRICAGGDQRWSSLPRQLAGTLIGQPEFLSSDSPCWHQRTSSLVWWPTPQ